MPAFTKSKTGVGAPRLNRPGPDAMRGRRARVLRVTPKYNMGQLYKASSGPEKKAARAISLRGRTLIPPHRMPKSIRNANARSRSGEWKGIQYTAYTAENGHKHYVTIFALVDKDDDKVTQKTKIRIDCNCPMHVYNYEFANAKVGNGYIFRSNGKPPRLKNPTMRVGLCKHSIRALGHLRSKGWPA